MAEFAAAVLMRIGLAMILLPLTAGDIRPSGAAPLNNKTHTRMENQPQLFSSAGRKPPNSLEATNDPTDLTKHHRLHARERKGQQLCSSSWQKGTNPHLAAETSSVSSNWPGTTLVSIGGGKNPRPARPRPGPLGAGCPLPPARLEVSGLSPVVLPPRGCGGGAV